MKTAAMMKTLDPDSSGARLVATDGRVLPLKGAQLRVEAGAGIARVILEQRFVNPYGDPLAVTYLMPLPADGAVSAYAFTIGDQRVVGEIDRRAAARERFEEALAAGHTAALVDQERTSLFTQEIGNIPAGAAVTAELTIDQKLAWLDEGAWEWRFPTAAMPRYQGTAGRVEDIAQVTVDVADGPLAARAQLELAIRDAVADWQRVESPTHALAPLSTPGAFALRAESGVALDRDLVVRWPVAAPRPGLTLLTARPAAERPHAARGYGLLTLVPPLRAHAGRAVPRDLCLLIDTSGSMGGEPLAQARRVLSAVVDTLGDDDTLEMISFAHHPERWKREPVRAGAAARAEAKKWLGKLHANGGTEMRSGIEEALAPLRADSQRQIVLVSDGAIGFESEIVAEILARLPASSRVHTVGVGSAVNRSLTQPAARAGRGVEIIIGLGEDPERAAQRLVARTTAPLVVELTLAGSALVGHAPARLPDLFAGAPAQVALALNSDGGELVARGRTRDGEWVERLTVPALATGAGNQGVVALFGRESVEDLTARLCAGESRDEIDRAIERIGLDFQLSTRLTSWVAVSGAATVDPTRQTRRERMPQALPFGVSMQGIGLQPAMYGAPAMRGMMRTRAASLPSAIMGMPPAAPPLSAGAAAPPSLPRRKSRLAEGWSKLFKKESAPAEADAAAESETRAGGGSEKRVRGRIVRTKGREWIVEIEAAEDGLDWAPPDDVLVIDGHGQDLRGHVDRRRTTAAGRLEPGQVARLVLVLDSDAVVGGTIRWDDLVIEV